jgi:hypothetical protein
MLGVSAQNWDNNARVRARAQVQSPQQLVASGLQNDENLRKLLEKGIAAHEGAGLGKSGIGHINGLRSSGKAMPSTEAAPEGRGESPGFENNSSGSDAALDSHTSADNTKEVNGSARGLEAVLAATEGMESNGGGLGCLSANAAPDSPSQGRGTQSRLERGQPMGGLAWLQELHIRWSSTPRMAAFM